MESIVSVVNDIAEKSLTSVLRSVSIHLTNNSRSNILINPQVYTYSGYCYDPPRPTVKTSVTEVSAFGQTKGTACGAVGVLTYDITQDRETKAVKRLAIMFSVPFDHNLYENWFAVGLFDLNQACDKSLFQRMYYDEGTFKRDKASGSEIRYQSGEYTLRGTMCPVVDAEIKVELWDSSGYTRPRTARNWFKQLGKHSFKCLN